MKARIPTWTTPLSFNQEVVLTYIRDHPGCTTPEICTALGMERGRVQQYAAVELVSRDLVTVIPVNGYPYPNSYTAVPQ